MNGLETEVYHILNYFPHWVWAWMILLALLNIAAPRLTK